jgi:pilus assembly protein CpaE
MFNARGDWHMNRERVVILVVTDDPDTAAQLRSSLGAEGTEFAVEIAAKLSAGLERLHRGGVDIILLDLMLPDSQGFETFTSTHEKANGVPIIVLSRHDDADLALQAVREGAQDYLVKGRMSGPSLVRCVRHALERQRHVARLLKDVREKGGGRIVSFMGAKGGVGTTTLCLNLAAALAQSGKKVIAVELWPFSRFSLHLRKSPAIHSGGLLKAGAGRIDSHALDQRLVALPFGFQALFAPPREEACPEPEPEQVVALLQAAASLCDYVVVDLPSQLSSRHQGVVRTAHFNVLVVEPEPLAIESARQTVNVLEAWGVASTSLGIVAVNRAALTNSARLPEIRTRTGCEIVGSVPSAGEGCVLASEAGKLLFSTNPEARFSTAVKEIAGSLAQSPVQTLRF